MFNRIRTVYDTILALAPVQHSKLTIEVNKKNYELISS
jgi:hypothetical protein